MKIGILSDTHSKIKEAKDTLDFFASNGAEFIIHAGDICHYETLQALKDCGIRYVAVYGNNDARLVEYHHEFNLVKEPDYFKVAGTKFKLMHLPFYMSADAEVVVYGHTHQFACEFTNGTLFLNSGEVCARNKPLSECVILDVSESRFDVTYFGDLIELKKFSYERVKNG
ncbi:MAG: YfcE family phosphodiesterase [Campylobacterales bacterium]|nr:YfcE family phosphodiesterase [Campylobacterales bacterium]